MTRGFNNSIQSRASEALYDVEREGVEREAAEPGGPERVGGEDVSSAPTPFNDGLKSLT
jgi:hypothetical protein